MILELFGSNGSSLPIYTIEKICNEDEAIGFIERCSERGLPIEDYRWVLNDDNHNNRAQWRVGRNHFPSLIMRTNFFEGRPFHLHHLS